MQDRLKGYSNNLFLQHKFKNFVLTSYVRFCISWCSSKRQMTSFQSEMILPFFPRKITCLEQANRCAISHVVELLTKKRPLFIFEKSPEKCWFWVIVFISNNLVYFVYLPQIPAKICGKFRSSIHSFFLNQISMDNVQWQRYCNLHMDSKTGNLLLVTSLKALKKRHPVLLADGPSK